MRTTDTLHVNPYIIPSQLRFNDQESVCFVSRRSLLRRLNLEYFHLCFPKFKLRDESASVKKQLSSLEAEAKSLREELVYREERLKQLQAQHVS